MLVRSEEIISVTDVQRQAKAIFTKLASGAQYKFVVMRNNTLAAVMLPAEHYESMLDELEDLRIEAVARDRLATYDPAKVIPLETMLEKYNVAREGE